MTNNRNDGKAIVGQVLEENHLVSIDDLCRSCMVETETITTLVAEGILDPQGEDVLHWRFSISSLRQVKTVIHLQRDLGVNLAGAALALELLEQISELKRRY